MLQREFLQSVERFLTETGMKAATFGKEAARDPNFVFELRKGRSPSLKLAERVEKFMRARRDCAA